MDIFGLSEVRWIGFGELRIVIDESILYFGVEEEYYRGVGFILKKEVRRSLLKWNFVNERIMSVRFNLCFVKFIVI